jgi:hypothetical protein
MAIFRFLANCLEHELVLFLRLLFGPLISLFGNDFNIKHFKTFMKYNTLQNTIAMMVKWIWRKR